MRVWFFGTSNALLGGGYAHAVQSILGVQTFNRSVGDQASIMGAMRLLPVANEIQPGDVVIWEYPLQDTNIGLQLPDTTSLFTCMDASWLAALEKGARVVVVGIRPRRFANEPIHQVPIFAEIKALAALRGLEFVDSAEVLGAGGMDHYSDELHLALGGRGTERLGSEICGRIRLPHRAPTLWRGPNVRCWSAAQLVADNTRLVHFKNSIIDVDAVDLSSQMIPLMEYTGHRTHVGLISEKGTGLIWCGHPECAAIATAYSPHLGDFPFLLRETAIECKDLRSGVLRAACRDAHRSGYGLVPTRGRKAFLFAMLTVG